MFDGKNRRANFRLHYPPGAGPILVAGGVSVHVLELSERGILFAGDAPGPGHDVAGVLTFPDGITTSISGVVVRAVQGRVAVRLTRAISLGRVLAEQRRVMRTFPGFLSVRSARGDRQEA